MTLLHSVRVNNANSLKHTSGFLSDILWGWRSAELAFNFVVTTGDVKVTSLEPSTPPSAQADQLIK